MKNLSFKTLTLGAMVTLMLAAGCKKDDVTAPVVTLVGANPMSVGVGGTFTDPGATATDDVDGDLTDAITTSGSVNTATAGAYTITYTASDAAGNVGTAARTVNVAFTRDGLLGTYTTANNCTSSPSNTVASTVQFQTNAASNKFTISPFYFNGGTLTCTLSGSSVTVDAGQAPGPTAYGVTGSGTFSTNGKVLAMSLTFTPSSGAPQTCTVTYSRP